MASILASNALTTLAAVNDELTLTSDAGGAQDLRVERFINEASDFVALFCDRVFERADGIVENVKGYGAATIRVARKPIIEITEVKIDGAVLNATEYYIANAKTLEHKSRIYRASLWPCTALARNGVSLQSIPGSEDASRIVVTYKGSYVTPKQAAEGLFSAAARTLPWDLEGAVIRLVASRWRRKGRDEREEARNFEASSLASTVKEVPPAIMATLAQYRAFPNA